VTNEHEKRLVYSSVLVKRSREKIPGFRDLDHSSHSLGEALLPKELRLGIISVMGLTPKNLYAIKPYDSFNSLNGHVFRRLGECHLEPQENGNWVVLQHQKYTNHEIHIDPYRKFYRVYAL